MPTITAKAPPLPTLPVNNAPLKTNFAKQSQVLTDFLTTVAAQQCKDEMELDFSWFTLDDEGLDKLAQALATGHCGKNLKINLTRNEISDRGLQTLISALSSGKCPQGLQIILRHNNIFSDGIVKLAAALPLSTFAVDCQLDLSDNRNLGKMAEGVLRQALAQASVNVQIKLHNDVLLSTALVKPTALNTQSTPENSSASVNTSPSLTSKL